MKILVTGAKGFIGKNLVAELKNRKYDDILEYDKETDPSLLGNYCKEADFVFHLAGVNRPKEQSEFMEGNFGFTSTLLNTLKKYKNKCPVMMSSSTQAKLDNPYGKSKKAGEDLLFDYSRETGVKVLIYRFPNVFGKWCKPNYNSAVATFCYNIAHDLPITVNDPSVVMNLVYIDDVVNELVNALEGKENRNGDFCEVPIVHTITLGAIVDLIYSFKKSREERSIPDMSDAFTKKLYSTYLSYLPKDKFSYELKMNIDNRGSFTEFIKTLDRGQVSINILKPSITKGNHWHHTKNEKFLVVNGKGVIRFRKIDCDEVIEYFVSGDKLEVVDIPPGYTHNIENLDDTDMVTIMWASEPFDPEKPDTYYLEV
ncbi:capsular polysaccharide biosynthesis protein CapF [Lutispora thermophila]|uniref:UDP-2-acetamido-2,6-beta-L-arabino-hexul-4-ose reductase n=1 Tax=Lutispora thermophila DSM 19022 TaxID=1122184 RepID=A0A1M6BXF4_9FIRM|nr:capsular polysaccharide biosynthesis protein CapF [Lutispora thermophila]SHI53377.1 UDP-2-acetamido-2,6-beta-L-arabino-hexul-4-ose reductase [Lutispora thermophila DSM 19022]